MFPIQLLLKPKDMRSTFYQIVNDILKGFLESFIISLFLGFLSKVFILDVLV